MSTPIETRESVQWSRRCAQVLSESMRRHDLSAPKLARGLELSPTLVRRWISEGNPTTIQLHRVMMLPLVIRRDVLAFMAEIDGAFIADRVTVEDDGDADFDLARDLLLSATETATHVLRIAGRTHESPMDAAETVLRCDAVIRAAFTVRDRSARCVQERGRRVIRPGLRKAGRPLSVVPEQAEQKVA